MFYGMDWTYLVLVLPAMLFALIASAGVKSTFGKYAKVRNQSGVTGERAARAVLDANGLHHIRIERVSGSLTDHYDPRAQVIRLSDDVYASDSCAAVGVACHEAGHAVQHATGYLPLRLRNASVTVVNIGSRLALPLILLGLVLSAAASVYGAPIAYIGIGCFSLTTLFALFTLPTEFNASRRAQEALERNGILTQKELRASGAVLRAAAMTYVASLAVSLAQLLRFLILVRGGSNRRR